MPTEIPQTNPGGPTEPPLEQPPGNPQPDIPPPVREPGAPDLPQELPGRTPDEMPAPGPSGPFTPKPATDEVDDGNVGNGIDDVPGSGPDVGPPVSEPPSL